VRRADRDGVARPHPTNREGVMADKCVCCGVTVMADEEDQPACGHRFCYPPEADWGRDHHEYDYCHGCEQEDDRRGEDRPEAA
jgi:hypothetical protein